jgi:hypothetical protein
MVGSGMAGSPSYSLFGTSGCHLCEEAEMLIRQALSPGRWRNLDISEDDRLSVTYGTRIPVLRHEGSGSELDWPFGREDLVGFLERSAARSPVEPHLNPP